MTDVWGGLSTDARFQNARDAASLVYRLVNEARQEEPGFEDEPETVLVELGVPRAVITAIAHEQHADTRAKAAIIEAYPGSNRELRMRWDRDLEELWFYGYIGWAGENEDALIRDLSAVTFADAKAAVEAFYAEQRGYAQLTIGFDYSDMTPEELEEVLRLLAAYRHEGTGGVLYEDRLHGMGKE